MKKSHLCLLTVAMVIASIIIAGCTTSNQPNQVSSSETSTNISTSSTSTTATTTTSSSVASASPTVTPSPSASATPATPTPASGKIATSIRLGQGQGQPPQLTFTKGQAISWVIEVTSSRQSILPGPVTVLIDGQAKGQVTPWGACPCEYTSFFDLETSGLSLGTHTVTVNYAGDSMYQPSGLTSNIAVT